MGVALRCPQHLEQRNEGDKQRCRAPNSRLISDSTPTTLVTATWSAPGVTEVDDRIAVDY